MCVDCSFLISVFSQIHLSSFYSLAFLVYRNTCIHHILKSDRIQSSRIAWTAFILVVNVVVVFLFGFVPAIEWRFFDMFARTKWTKRWQIPLLRAVRFIGLDQWFQQHWSSASIYKYFQLSLLAWETAQNTRMTYIFYIKHKQYDIENIHHWNAFLFFSFRQFDWCAISLTLIVGK